VLNILVLEKDVFSATAPLQPTLAYLVSRIRARSSRWR